MPEVPPDLKYSKSHEWVQIDNDKAIVGITDFAQEELHEIVYIELPEVGRKVSKSDEVAAVESVKARSEIYSPLSGEILRINEALIETTISAKPELINESPYGDGWLFEIRLSEPAEIDELLSAEQYLRILDSQ